MEYHFRWSLIVHVLYLSSKLQSLISWLLTSLQMSRLLRSSWRVSNVTRLKLWARHPGTCFTGSPHGLSYKCFQSWPSVENCNLDSTFTYSAYRSLLKLDRAPLKSTDHWFQGPITEGHGYALLHLFPPWKSMMQTPHFKLEMLDILIHQYAISSHYLCMLKTFM